MKCQAMDEKGLARSHCDLHTSTAIEDLPPCGMIDVGHIDIAPVFRRYTREEWDEGTPDDFVRSLPDYEWRSIRTEFNQRNSQ